MNSGTSLALDMNHWSCRAMQIKTLKEREKDHLLQVLVKTHWNLQKTALLLQIPLAEVRRKIKEHRLERPSA